MWGEEEEGDKKNVQLFGFTSSVKVPFIELGIIGEGKKELLPQVSSVAYYPVESGKENQCPSIAWGGHSFFEKMSFKFCLDNYWEMRKENSWP